MTKAASTEFPATARLSRRIELELKVACISGIKVIIALEGVAANPSPVMFGLLWDMLGLHTSQFLPGGS